MFKDIHRASTIIADSIRVRESRALQLLQLQAPRDNGTGHVDISNPHRCPFCLMEFHDPTVISKVCGHGMHQKCVKNYISKTDDPLMCSICRAPFHEDDLVLLKGVIPPVTEAAVWRLVHLTEPWEQSREDDASNAKTQLDSSRDRLLINIKFLLNHQQQFSRSMEALLEGHRRLKNDILTARSRIRKKKMELNGRERKIEEAEDKLIITKVRNEEFLSRCTKSIQYEESYLLKIMESLARRQNKMIRSNSDLAAREKDLHTTIKDFDNRRKKEEDELKTLAEMLKKEKEKTILDEAAVGSDIQGGSSAFHASAVFDVDDWNPDEERLNVTGGKRERSAPEMGSATNDTIEPVPDPQDVEEQVYGIAPAKKRNRRL